MTEYKLRLFEHCKQLLRSRHRHLHERMLELQDSAAGETKSTAGDKHETALAMLQLEQEQLRRQMREASEQLAILDRLVIDRKSERIVAGSLIQTDQGPILIATALGKIEFENDTVIIVSAGSPLGQRLIGLKAGDDLNMNGISYRIRSVS